MKVVQNYNKYENYIRIGHTATSNGDGTYTCSDLQNFPTPASLGRTLHDVDKDAFTDLKGYTHRNRVRHDVEDLEVSFPLLSALDEATILNMISPSWIYVEIPDKKVVEEVKDNNNYVQYLRKSDNSIYWYNTTQNKLYDANYTLVSNPDMSEYMKYYKNGRKCIKMYASDKQWDTFILYKDVNNNWQTEDVDLTFSLIQE